MKKPWAGRLERRQHNDKDPRCRYWWGDRGGYSTATQVCTICRPAMPLTLEIGGPVIGTVVMLDNGTAVATITDTLVSNAISGRTVDGYSIGRH